MQVNVVYNYGCKKLQDGTFTLSGDIAGGLPRVDLPPFGINRSVKKRNQRFELGPLAHMPQCDPLVICYQKLIKCDLNI